MNEEGCPEGDYALLHIHLEEGVVVFMRYVALTDKMHTRVRLRYVEAHAYVVV